MKELFLLVILIFAILVYKHLERVIQILQGVFKTISYVLPFLNELYYCIIFYPNNKVHHIYINSAQFILWFLNRIGWSLF